MTNDSANEHDSDHLSDEFCSSKIKRVIRCQRVANNKTEVCEFYQLRGLVLLVCGIRNYNFTNSSQKA
jgi:hypothetical protein